MKPGDLVRIRKTAIDDIRLTGLFISQKKRLLCF